MVIGVDPYIAAATVFDSFSRRTKLLLEETYLQRRKELLLEATYIHRLLLPHVL
jgi:hypothetical protein